MKIIVPCEDIERTFKEIYNTFYPNIPREGKEDGTDDIQFDVKDGSDIENVKESIVSIREYVKRMQVMLSTNVLVSPVWTNNILNNIPYMMCSENADSLKNCHKDKPVIIASAGPSLQKQLEVLREFNSTLPVIALGTSLKPCLVNGVGVQLCMSLDGNIKNYSHFKDIYENMTWDKHTALVYDPMIYPKVLHGWEGRKFMIRTNNAYLHEFMGNYTGVLPVMPSGFSVATTAFSMAHYIGANPIIFIGQDLAYAKDGSSHTTGTIWDGTKITGKESNLMEVSDWDLKGKVLTSQVFAAVLEFFEGQAKEMKSEGIDIINCTEGGAYIKNMKHIPLREVLNRYPDEIELQLPALKDMDVPREALKEKLRVILIELSEIHALSQCYSNMVRDNFEPDKDFFCKQLIARTSAMKFLDHIVGHSLRLYEVENGDYYESLYREAMSLQHIKLASEDVLPKLKNSIGRL